MRTLARQLRSRCVAMRRQQAPLDAWKLLRQEVADALSTLQARILAGQADVEDRDVEGVAHTWEEIESELKTIAVAIEEEIASREE